MCLRVPAPRLAATVDGALRAFPDLRDQDVPLAGLDRRHAVVLVAEKDEEVSLLERMREEVVVALGRFEHASFEVRRIRKHPVDRHLCGD